MLLSVSGMAQQAIVRGVVFNEQQVPQSGVNITWSGGGTQTDESGFYTLSIPAEKTIQLNFSHIAYKAIKAQFNLKENEMVEFNPVLNAKVEQISDVVITANTTDQLSGITNLTPETVRKIPGANPGVENLLQALPGVNAAHTKDGGYRRRQQHPAPLSMFRALLDSHNHPLYALDECASDILTATDFRGYR